MRLFISYAHKDKQQVQEVVHILQAGNHNPWFDQSLVVGLDWQEQLLKAIQGCDGFVYCLSPISVASEWCQWEFSKAIQLGKPVVPVLLKKGTKLPDLLKNYQYADFSQGATAEATARLMGGLNAVAITFPPENAPVVTNNPQGVPSQAPQADPTHPSSRRFNITDPAIIAAIITGIFALVAAFVMVAVPKLWGDPARVTEPPTLAIPATATSSLQGNITDIAPSQAPATRSVPINLQRSPDTIAICSSTKTDLSSLQVRIGLNESYILGQLFPASQVSPADQCWCIQQRNPQFSAPAACSGSNTKIEPNVSDWRNAQIALTSNNGAIGICEAQPEKDSPYSCPLR